MRSWALLLKAFTMIGGIQPFGSCTITKTEERERRDRQQEKRMKRTNSLIDSLEKTRGFRDGCDPVGHATDTPFETLCEGNGLVVDAGAKDKQLGISLHTSERDELSV